MKYLKTYTLFERVSKETKIFEDSMNSELYHDIKDITAELGDNGILTEIVPVDGYDPVTLDTIEESEYEITIHGEAYEHDYYDTYYDTIKWGDIEDVVLRLVDFMEMMGYNFLSIATKPTTLILSTVDGRSYKHSPKDWLTNMKYKDEYVLDSLTLKFSKNLEL
jgi:hypothetical protein